MAGIVISMECPICSELFDDSTHTPRLLRCGHTCCEQCLNHVIKDTQIACPTCRLITVTTSIPALSKNFTVLDLASRYTEEDHSPAPKQYADTHCPQHPDELVIRYCLEDTISVCPECILAHNGHKLVKLNDPCKPYSGLKLQMQVRKMREKVQEMRGAVQVKKLEMQQKHEGLMMGLSKEMQRIDAGFAWIYERFEDRKNELKGKIAEEMKEEEGKVAQEQQEIDFHLDTLNVTSLRLSCLLDSKEPSPRLSESLVSLKRDIHQLLTASQHLSSLDTSSLFTPTVQFHPKPLEQEISRYGTITMADDITNPAVYLFGTQNLILKYSLTQQKWMSVRVEDSSGFEFKNFASIVAVQNSILITGGAKSNEVFEFRDRKIVKRCNMLHIRSSHNAVYFKGIVYCIGGYSGTAWHDKCEQIPISTYNSSAIASLNQRRCAFSSSINNRLIYVFGGYDGARYLDSIERYYVDQNRWEQLSCVLHKPLQNTGAACYAENKIMVAGGYNERGTLSVVRSLDVSTLEWTALPSMTNTRYLMNKFHYCGGVVYAIGGSAQGQYIEYFTVSEGSWASLKSYKDFTEDTMYKWAAVLTHDSFASEG